MTTQTKHGTFTKPYSYNQCPTVGCSYELPSGLPFDMWPEMVESHVSIEHSGNGIWTKLIGGPTE